MLPPPVSNLAIPAWGHGRGLDGTQMLICKQHTCKNLLKFANRWLLKDLRGVAEEYKLRVEKPRGLCIVSAIQH